MKHTCTLLNCHICSSEPRLIKVGDQKEFLVYICSKCYETPVHYDEASLTEAHAARTWNRRTYEALSFD